MKKIRALLVLSILALLFSGCAPIERGMLTKNTYYSTASPNIQLTIDSSFKYSQRGSGQLKHQFTETSGRGIYYIHHIGHNPNETQVDYYNHPTHWIFWDTPIDEQIETGELSILDKKWYYCNSLKKSGDDCALIRDVRRFTRDHDIFLIRYVEEIPSYDCKNWQNINHLTDKQKERVNIFERNFSKFIEIKNYDEDS